MSWSLLFHVLHMLLILFHLFGWLWRPLRPYHFASLNLTLLSWTVLGFFFGFGYCPLTEWHWQSLMASGLARSELPNSYVTYVFMLTLDQKEPPRNELVFDVVVAVATVGVWIVSFVLLRRDFCSSHKESV